MGGKTIENRFSFLNLRLRAGVAHDFEKVGLRMGLEGRSYDYTLEQTNNVEDAFRMQDESWIEWTPTAAAVFRLGTADLHYGCDSHGDRPAGRIARFAREHPDRGGAFVVAVRGDVHAEGRHRRSRISSGYASRFHSS